MLLLFDKPFLRFILDILNYSVLIAIFYYIYKKKIISKKELLIYSIFCFTTFLVNEGLIPWNTFWDQQSYVNLAKEIRYAWLDGNFLPDANEKPKLIVSSYIMALFPIISFNTINSVAFVNKGIYCLTLIYINYKNKINKSLFFLLLCSPSILIYSSVSLRDLFILSLMLLSIFLFLSEKNI